MKTAFPHERKNLAMREGCLSCCESVPAMPRAPEGPMTVKTSSEMFFFGLLRRGRRAEFVAGHRYSMRFSALSGRSAGPENALDKYPMFIHNTARCHFKYHKI